MSGFFGPFKSGGSSSSGGGIGSSINYAPAGGAQDPGAGVAGFGAAVGRVKITLAANTTFASWPAGVDTQQVFCTIVAGNFTLGLLAGGGAGKPFLASDSPFVFVLNDTFQMFYDAGLSKWLIVP